MSTPKLPTDVTRIRMKGPQDMSDVEWATFIRKLREFKETGRYVDEFVPERDFPVFIGLAPPNHPFPAAFGMGGAEPDPTKAIIYRVRFTATGCVERQPFYFAFRTEAERLVEQSHIIHSQLGVVVPGLEWAIDTVVAGRDSEEFLSTKCDNPAARTCSCSARTIMRTALISC